ncbi:prepilin-type N-terminal cleavage/methylation domain-containing protein [Chthonomonas calidirosea]|uniref:Prepilin-type N-terminal cleavage/methylation domain n=1 Tax=Chthonomonas calidirosea (strain DSM 23976 / ICMP 18418 / T49) TaxID=1303518 RepID=S0EZ00_CHTCT|nr:type II secretion system protein [Chthonomonas calidirosea]CCW35852.1 prepilin-type N-terminal cleavage/methylation domain [Chthonomonas calidirosea T49]CEK18028.1 prepilin-type N-terminal cleavage/methylation domain-containing protein [Chthonomonas calidirosea]CEK18029.1 prepilin-type N-terminal cleavage/methylation domain-containing protein [Chthonomonas calidirosea]CEK19054.1 prepilin-type N-terminal cleavage/methylation domain-containing protein [Chthonomonas calidirosea]
MKARILDQKFRFSTLRRKARQPSGFTLMELLFVMAVLAVLSAVLLPVFLSGRRSAQKAACLQNLHQIGIALALYVQDYDEAFPAYTVDPQVRAHPDDLLTWHNSFCRAEDLQPSQVSWASLALPYALSSLYGTSTQGDSPLFCPADTDRKARPVTSYEFKMFLSEGVHINDVEYPADTAMVWEQWDYHDPGHYSEYDSRAHLNTVFVDGHAKSVWLVDTTSARYGNGPDLHWPFVGQGKSAPYTDHDTLP